ncbi:PREDICTED: uncharacterized protein LOC106106923 [Papilio polytes]|uniref:uncharacterized protein LOC106106923 n=1 Tax=Papilio polytes TaxID=76194 RepID=UPI000675F770|nr:PREDICTED: uncharacterized protein LOC106106923 [Papilio polytes]
MQYLQLLFICSYIFNKVSSKINYCGATMCAGTDSHTFCQHSKGPGPLCTGLMPASLSKEEKMRILTRLNHRRNDAALGLLGNLPAAGDMLNMRWVEVLAREAQLWADQCAPPKFPEDHDVCRDLYSLPVGQNVASVVGEAPGLRVESLVDLWYMQGRHYKGNISSYVPPTQNSSYYGDFAQMLWSKTFMVGCGRSRFMSMWQDRPRTVERLVCNMAPRGPRPEQPLWQVARPASLCPPRTTQATHNPGLCIVNDSLKFDKKHYRMPVEDSVLLSTVLELDRNSSFDSVENLDEIYLAKLAGIMLEKSNNDQQESDPINVTEIIGKMGIKFEDFNSFNKRIANERRKIRRYMNNYSKYRRKLRTVGRPKAYYLYELSKEEDLKRTKYTVDINPVIAKETKESLIEEVTKENEEVPTIETELSTNGIEVSDVEILNSEPSSKTNTQDEKRITEIAVNSTVKTTEEAPLNSSINLTQETSTKSSSIESKSSEINDDLIKEYLSDPETARELQETIMRMEHTMSGQPMGTDMTPMLVRPPTPMPTYYTKVRRELKTTQSEEFRRFKKMFQKRTQTPIPGEYDKEDKDDKEDGEKEGESIVIGNKRTVLQSLLSYLPNMRSLGLISGSEYGVAYSIKPSYLLILFSCFYIFL